MNLLNKILDIVMTKKILGSVIVILTASILIKLLNNIISKILTLGKSSFEVKRRRTIIKLLQNFIKYLIWIIAILTILDFYNFNTKSLIASIGVVGAVLGLALQDTVKDIIGGISLILENYLTVGDTVTYQDFTGEVIELGIRTTKIKGFNGEVMVIANRNIDNIINASQKKTTWLLEISTAYEEKVDKVAKVLQDVIDEAIKEKLILSDSRYLGINNLETHSVKYLIKIHCEQTERYVVRRIILERIKRAYEKNNIKIPYPQLEVHHGKDF